MLITRHLNEGQNHNKYVANRSFEKVRIFKRLIPKEIKNS
jgi:hypothetical protein